MKSLSRVQLFATPWTLGFSIHGIFLGKSTGEGCHFLLRGTSQPRDRTQVSHIVDRHFTVWATREVHQRIVQVINFFSSHFLSSWVYMKSFISWLLQELSNCNPHFFFVYSNTCDFSNLEYRYNVYFPLMESENIIVQFVSYHKLLYAHEISNHIKKRTLLMLIMSPLR